MTTPDDLYYLVLAIGVVALFALGFSSGYQR